MHLECTRLRSLYASLSQMQGTQQNTCVGARLVSFSLADCKIHTCRLLTAQALDLQLNRQSIVPDPS